MNPVIVFLLIFGSLFIGALLWTKLRPDPVGRRLRTRRRASGLQGRLNEWLYWEAPLHKPSLSKVVETEIAPRSNPWLRALQSLVRREALTLDIDLPQAYQELKQRATSPLARAFVNGQVMRSIRVHWRTRYTGPDALYGAWLYGIAYIRYGRRHLHLETLAQCLKEFRNA